MAFKSNRPRTKAPKPITRGARPLPLLTNPPFTRIIKLAVIFKYIVHQALQMGYWGKGYFHLHFTS
jgi:hypothetical protein